MQDKRQEKIKLETTGTVIGAKKQWWLRINRKAVRVHCLDGATFPYIISVVYHVEGREYKKRKWIPAGQPVPAVGAAVRVRYSPEKPEKACILL